MRPGVDSIDLQTIIEQDFVCNELHRAFFKKHLGTTFSFDVPFLNWLKANAGRTYQEAIEAYCQIQNEKKESKSTVTINKPTWWNSPNKADESSK